SVHGVGDIEHVSRDGRWALISRLVHRGDNNLFLVDLASGAETLLTPHDGPGSFGGLFAADGRGVVLVTNGERDTLAFAELSIAGGKPGKPSLLATRDDAELDDMVVDPQGRSTALVWNVGGKSELWLYDLLQHTSHPAAALPGEIVSG